MKKLAKTIMFALLLAASPVRIWAQNYTPYDNGFLFNVFEIENVEERVQLASALATSDIWLCNPTDNPGELFIRPNSYYADIPIYAEFDYLRMTLREEYEAASSLPKEEFREICNSWANNISSDYYNFLISDHLDRANHCMDAEPFCTSNVYNFPALNSGYSWSGPNYGCLGSSPTSHHSFWYYMRIGVAGNITIKIEASFDVDFALWGPFSNQTDPCPTAAGQTGLLTANCYSYDCPDNTEDPNFYPSGNLHDCSFDARHYEYAHVVNGQVGQFFILLITNWSGSDGTITFQKYAGDGETDCGIMPPMVNNDGPYCVGETIHLTANGQSGASYSWTGPGGFTSNQQNPTRPNCTMAMAGDYTCTISLGGQTNNATTHVAIHPMPTANFTATTVCKGNPTQFTSTSTTNPSGQQINSYQWNFGDGQSGSGQSVSHTYAQAGNYNATLTVSTGGHCTSTKTQTVTVYAEPVANAGPDQTISYGGTAQLDGSGGAGTFNFHWEPANMVTNPNVQNTQTVALTQDQTYTLTVTNPQGQCVDSDEVTIHINGSAMTVTAGPNISICQGGSGQIYVSAGGGTGNLTYSWTPTTGLSNPNIYNPIASPSQTTTYTCHVSDGLTAQNARVTDTVNDVIVENEYQFICPDETYPWHGTAYSNAGTYQFDTVTDQGCDKTIYLHLEVYPTYDETTITDEICFGETYMFFDIPVDHSITGLPYTLQSIHGCDSIVRLNLTVWPENEVDLKEVTLCPEQLPYTFYGVDYYEDVIETVFDTDIHGCDSIVTLVLTVSDYYKPEPVTKYVGYYGTPSYSWYIPEANTTLTYTTEGTHIDTLSTAACEGIFTLNLYFAQIPETTHIYDTVCDNYDWYVNGVKVGSYDQSCTVPYSIPFCYDPSHPNTQFMYYDPSSPSTPIPCTQDYMLHLIVNHTSNDNTINIDGNDPSTLPPHLSHLCDRFDWQFGWNEESYPYFGDTDPNGDTKTIPTLHGCDSIVTLIISNMKYTPAPDIIRPTQVSTTCFGLPEDPNVPDTAMCAAVVTNTEFFSFKYTFYVEETNPKCQWDACTWEISKPSWNITYTPVTRPNGKCYSECTVYVADRDEDYVKLTAIISNECDSDTCKFYLKSSFLDVDEYELAPAHVNIVPNPNNGQMRLDFENMEGRTAVKVFDMTGNQIDAFETIINSNRYNYDYHMKHFADGIYFFVVSNNNRVLTKKVVIIR